MHEPGQPSPVPSPERSFVCSALALAVFGGMTAGAAALGAAATGRGTGLWYRTLRKPRFNPPSWVFGPVWTGLYGLIAYSGYRVFKGQKSPARTMALALWGTQLGLNAAWSVLFFGQHRKGAALADLGALIGSIGGYMAAARKVDRTAAWLMAPYLAWCGFACLLNEEIVRRN